MKKFVFLFALLTLFSFASSAQNPADKYLGNKWQPTRLSSYSAGTAPEIRANLVAFRTLVDAERKTGTGKYIQDIINGLWFFATSHTWSTPEETGGKLPPRDGQSPTRTSLETASLIMSSWNLFSSSIKPVLPALEPALDTTLKRLCGKTLN